MSILDTQYWQYADSTIKGMLANQLQEKKKLIEQQNPRQYTQEQLILPLLVHEIIKAIMELFSHQGETRR